MATATVTKHVYCKLAKLLDPTGKKDLQVKLSDALALLNKIGKRKEKLGNEKTYIRSIIYHRKYRNMIFGILASYERGTHQLTVAEDDDAEMLAVAQVAPPVNDDNKRQEFLEGLCYFGVAHNHVVMVPSRALGSKPLESHLNWVLKKADVLEAGNQLALTDHVAQATRDRIRAVHVKEIEIGVPFVNTEEIKSESSKADFDLSTYSIGSVGIDLLRQVLPDVNKMRLIDAVDGNMEVTLKIRYNRSTTKKAHDLLDNIAIAMRHADEDDVVLKLNGGGKVKGKELKITTPISVQARDGIPNPDEIFEKMHNWLVQQIENKIIEP